LGSSRLPRLLFTPLFSLASDRFSELAADFDGEVKNYGFNEAAGRFLPYFTRDIHVCGAGRIPSQGPLLIVSNHPGVYDGLVIASGLPRPDLKIVVSGNPFIRSLSATANHLIFCSLDTFERMKVVRAIVRHLHIGGAVLIFPSGGIDPDPAVMPGALDDLDAWSPSLDVILRRVPSTRVLITSVSGVLHAGWARSPIVRMLSGRRNQQRAAEFFQVIQQMLFPNSLMVSPSLWFAEPIHFMPNKNSSSLPTIIAHAKEHFKQVIG
jgi:hypothetical protein